MLKRYVVVVGLMLFVGGTAFAQEIDWGDDIKKAIEKAKTDNKPICIYFTCGMQAGQCWQGCQQESATFEEESVAEYGPKFICVQLDPTDEDVRDTCKSLGIKVKKGSHSRLVFLKPDGTPLKDGDKDFKVEGPFANQQGQTQHKKVAKKLKSALELAGEKKEEKKEDEKKENEKK